MLQDGFPNGTGTSVATFKNLTVFISQSSSTYHAFYSQCDFKRNGCIKQLCLLTCKLLLALCAPHLLIFRLHFEKQSKKLQSSSPVQFCSRMSLILGSKKAISTSMATTCGSKHHQSIRPSDLARHSLRDRAERAFLAARLWKCCAETICQ